MDALLDKSFKLAVNKEVGKFTVLVMDPATGPAYPDGCNVPSAANAGPIAGVAQESILPNGVADYSGGQYLIASGTAWPANSVPASATGRAINTRMTGISRCVAASAISVGDEVNVADSQGRIKTVNETAGTLVFVLGRAMDAAGQAGDVIRVLVLPYNKKT